MATAVHQNEGNNTRNDFWAWEQIPGHVADGSTSGLACDWWNRAEEDFDRAAALGLNTLRMSVEWSRAEPRPGVWDVAAFDRYREMLKGLQARGVEPMVTLHHFTNPLWLADVGGWVNQDVVPLFERYAAKVVETLSDLCQMWCTITEPNMYAAHACVLGKWSPGEKGNHVLDCILAHESVAVQEQDIPSLAASNCLVVGFCEPSSPYWQSG